jgi:hypothetical protein
MEEVRDGIGRCHVIPLRNFWFLVRPFLKIKNDEADIAIRASKQHDGYWQEGTSSICC